MATLCVDISGDKKLSNGSPIAYIAFIIAYIVTNLVMKPDFLFFIIVLMEFGLCMIFFQVSPRLVFLTLRFLTTQEYLSPTVKDKEYHYNEKDLKELRKILK